jgi:hypothetical protein
MKRPHIVRVTGWLDEIRLFNRALRPLEIEQLFAADNAGEPLK